MFYIETFPVGTFQCNCSIIVNKSTLEAIVVDPGDEIDQIWDRLLHLKVKVKALWHTHAHLDHLGATKELFERLSLAGKVDNFSPPQIYLHPEDTWLYKNVALQSQLLRLEPFQVPDKFSFIKNNQIYSEFENVKALHTPGHTPGSCCLLLEKESEFGDLSGLNPYGSDAPAVLISGDTLFRRSIGRTDLWGGDLAKIKTSISQKLFTLPEDTLVIPGHGPLTSIEEEKEKNPYID